LSLLKDQIILVNAGAFSKVLPLRLKMFRNKAFILRLRHNKFRLNLIHLPWNSALVFYYLKEVKRAPLK
jgi:hypothetical protein